MAILLVILGAIPYLLGYAMNWYMMEHMDALLPFKWIAVLFLLFWGLLAFLCNRKGAHSKQVILFLNLFAALNLVLLGVKEVILGAYWSNWLGLVTQFFYLPILNLGFGLSSWFSSVFVAYVVCFLLMVAFSYAGCRLRKDRYS